MLAPVTSRAVIVGYAVLCVICAGLAFGTVALSGKLNTEKARHNATRQALIDTRKDLAAERAALAVCQGGQEALQGRVRECEDLRAEDAGKAATRETIMREAQSLPADKPKNRTVDNATRSRVADHFNAVW